MLNAEINQGSPSETYSISTKNKEKKEERERKERKRSQLY